MNLTSNFFVFVVDYCHGIVCNHGVCVRGQLGYTCTCNPGYWGTHCNKSKLTLDNLKTNTSIM